MSKKSMDGATDSQGLKEVQMMLPEMAQWKFLSTMQEQFVIINAAVAEMQVKINNISLTVDAIFDRDKNENSEQTDEYIECKICKKRFKSLGRHLISAHKVSAEEYRNMFGLPARYALSSFSVTKSRSEAGKKIDFRERIESAIMNRSKNNKSV